MKTKIEAVKTLMAAGWTEVEIKTALGGIPELGDSTQVPTNTPWWNELDEDEYLNGIPTDGGWELLLGLDSDK